MSMADGTVDPANALAKATLKVVQRDPKAVHYTYTGGVMIKGQDIKFGHVISIDIHRNFVHNFSDITTIEVTLPTYEFYKYVCMNLNDLEVYLKKRQMAENSTLFVRGGENTVKKYKAILQNPPLQGLAQSASNPNNRITNPSQSITTAVFQLVELGALDIKMSMFGGLMSETKPSEALMMILSGMSQGVTLDKGLKIEGVHMSPPDNDVPTTILIPHQTPVKDMAQFIQQQYGIYNFGIGSYLFKRHWYVYPLFNVQRFAKEQYRVAISVIDKMHDLGGSIPRTYVVDNGTITIATSDASGVTQSEGTSQLNAGTGISVQNPIDSITKAIQREDNKVTLNGAVSTSTFNVVEREDGYQNILNVYTDTTNMANIVSKISGNQGTYIDIEWKHANPELLQPGMPIKIVYTANKKKEAYGVLHEYHAISVRGTKDAVDVPFLCTVSMKIYAVLTES